MSEQPKTIQDVFASAFGPLAAEMEAEMRKPEVEAALTAVNKLSTYMPVSCCVMTDTTGVNHCEHPPPPPVPRLTRLRWRLRDRWSTFRMQLGSRVAGVDLDRED